MTDRYAVLGNPIAHSKSPAIHAEFARQTGQDMVYTALLAPKDGFREVVEAFRAGGGLGANVTVPFKEEAFRWATRCTPRAEAAGAVNTLRFDEHDILGDNTDGVGLVRDLRGNLGMDIAGRRILLVGAGGAAKGVLLPLLEQRPAALFIVNRTADKARDLAGRFDCQGGGFDALPSAGFDLVIHASAASLAGERPPLPATAFNPGCLAYDMMYGRETPFMAHARDCGATVADGLGMLVEQAAEAFLLWRGVRPETRAVIDQIRGG